LQSLSIFGEALFFSTTPMARSVSIFKEKRARIILYVLVIYMLFQFVWWGYLLIGNYKELYALNPVLTDVDRASLLQKKIWMLIGEGTVFLVIIFIGFRYLNKSITRELQLARLQKTFLLSVTHELKTPISAIKLFLETMRTRKLTVEQQSSILNDALRETKRLQALSENILVAQRMELQGTEFLHESVDVAAIIEAEAARYRDVFNASVQCEMQTRFVMKGDKNLLQSLFSNLIDNAIKYAPKGSDILVRGYSYDNEHRVEVCDTGPGIADEEKEKVFEKFYRVGNEETRNHKGAGLGLYIVSSVVKMHGGHIFVRDNHPVGTIITVCFKNNNFNEKG
jgi:signal transduction histidine kinase